MNAWYIVIDSYTMNWFGFGAISPSVSAARAARSRTWAAETGWSGAAAVGPVDRPASGWAGEWPTRVLTTPTATSAASPVARAARQANRHATRRGGTGG